MHSSTQTNRNSFIVQIFDYAKNETTRLERFTGCTLLAGQFLDTESRNYCEAYDNRGCGNRMIMVCFVGFFLKLFLVGKKVGVETCEANTLYHPIISTVCIFQFFNSHVIPDGLSKRNCLFFCKEFFSTWPICKCWKTLCGVTIFWHATHPSVESETHVYKSSILGNNIEMNASISHFLSLVVKQCVLPIFY